MKSKINFLFFMAIVFLFLTFLWVFWKSRMLFFYSREKGCSFECGFDKKDKSRIPFSKRFFSMLILFLMFDVELVMLMHMPLIKKKVVKNWFLYVFFFLFLYFGLVEEWRRSLLDWKM